MGLFDFVKDAGEGLLNQLGKGFKEDSEAVTTKVKDLGLSVEGLSVEVDGDKAVVKGKAGTQAEREKAVVAVGNTPGIAQVDDQLDVDEEPKAESQYYKVKGGDSLSKIAKEFYGDTGKYPVIFEANKPMLKDPDKIYPGQVLRIPPLD